MNLKNRNNIVTSFVGPEEILTLRMILARSKIFNKGNIDNIIMSYLPKILLILINAGGVGLNLQQFSGPRPFESELHHRNWSEYHPCCSAPSE